MSFVKFSSAALCVALGIKVVLGWSFWTILFLLLVAYGIRAIATTNPRLAKAISAIVIIALVGSFAQTWLKGNFPLSSLSLPWGQSDRDAKIASWIDPGLSSVKAKLVLELRRKDEELAAEIPAMMAAGKYEEIKTRTQELINLRKEIEKLLDTTPQKKLLGQDLYIGPGIYSFQLNPLEKTKEKITVQPDCEYSFSSSTRRDPVKQDFFLVYEDGKIIKIDRADVPVPPGPGPFQIQAGELGACVKLLIVKK